MAKDNNQNKQLTELSEEELKQVNGGVGFHFCGGPLITDARCIVSTDELSSKAKR